MSGPDSSPETPGSRGSRIGDLACVVLAIVFVGGLVFLAFAGQGRGIAYVVVPMTGLTLLAILLARHFQVRRWTRVAGAATLLFIFLAFMATDEPMVRPPLTLEQLAPSFPGAEVSHHLLLGLSKQDLELVARNRSVFNGMGPTMALDPETPDKFRNLLTGQRTQIEADWDNLTTIRTWWDELAKFEHIGDVSAGLPDDPLPSFQAIRAYSQTASMMAGLQALDGEGDAAFATLTTAIDVARKLEPSSRSLIRSMIARVAQTQVMATATFVLDHAKVSPESKARFAAALASGTSGEQGIRQMIAVETARTTFILKDPVGSGVIFRGGGDSWQATLANTAGRTLYNANRTVNTYNAWSSRMQDLAAQRQWNQMNAETKQMLDGDLSLRNIAGGLFLREATPQYGKIVESYWKAEDKREALLKRLKEGEPPAAPAAK